MFSHTRKPLRDTHASATEPAQSQNATPQSLSSRHNALELPLHGQPATEQIDDRYNVPIPGGGLSGLNANYLLRFKDRFSALEKFKGRGEVLTALKKYVNEQHRTVSTDMDIALILSELLDQKLPAESAATPQATTTSQTATKPPQAITPPQQQAVPPPYCALGG